MPEFVVAIVTAVCCYLTFAAFSHLAATPGSSRIRDWHEAARAVGLTRVKQKRRLGISSTLTGTLGPLRVQLEKYTRLQNEYESGTRVTIRLDRSLVTLSLRRQEDLGLRDQVQSIETAFRTVVGEDVKTGDNAFDDEVHLQGPEPLAMALLDAETRRLVLNLFRGRVERSGREPVEIRAQLRDGILQADVSEAFPVLASHRSQNLVDVVRGLLALARRLVAPPDIAARIAENLRGEPVAGVRLRLLLTLIDEFPEHPNTRDALLAATEDPDGEVRMRAAIALGAEGRPVLLAVAGGEGASDATAAQAVAALADELTCGETQDILDHALRAGQETTARKSLDVLARRHGPAAISTIAKVLAVQADALGDAAALALGATGIPAAEAPLLEALERDVATTRIAAVQALGRVGGVTAVPKLREAAERHARDGNLGRAVRQAVAEIQSRLAGAGGASPGQLSLASDEAGQLSLVEETVEGQLTLAEPTAEAEERALHQPQTIGIEKAVADEDHGRERQGESE